MEARRPQVRSADRHFDWSFSNGGTGEPDNSEQMDLKTMVKLARTR